MNRKQKRELRKDKPLFCNLYNIIDKYLPNLFNMFDNLKYVRQKGKITYSMKTICVTRLFAWLCGITTMNSLTNKFNIQKNNIFDITHMCSLNYNAIKAHYLFIQFAHAIRQLLDLGSLDVRSFQGKIKEISHTILTELISKIVNSIINHSFQLRFDTLVI